LWVEVATASSTGFGKRTRVTSGVNLPAIGSHYVSASLPAFLVTTQAPK
jgi:hypothetical protein